MLSLGSVTFNQAGDPIRLSGINLDFTEHKQAEVSLLAKQGVIERINEELQSSNQELETTNEELQSTNEELRIINDLLRQRTTDLNQANTFLNSILTSLKAAMVVINTQSIIRSWNYEAQNLWGLWEKEVLGTSLFDLDTGLPVAQLQEPIHACLSGQPFQQVLILEAINRRGRSIQCRVSLHPLIGEEQDQQGIILLMEEIK
ncbi:MAG: PAS domain-containing protein [Leptolyngbyaceae cyanobacterium SM2_5_2]|nr:PAS domain-containing protein [Leptolyngbyaceae cyanobacterium SM2_5_2]